MDEVESFFRKHLSFQQAIFLCVTLQGSDVSFPVDDFQATLLGDRGQEGWPLPLLLTIEGRSPPISPLFRWKKLTFVF